MSLILQLPSYDNQSWYWDRDQFITTFPESVPARAVDLDRTTELIQIHNPAVTPQALDYLQGLLKEGYPDPPRTIDTKSTGKYLGIDLLMVVADDQYATFALQHPDINLLDKTTWSSDIYSQIIEFSIKFNYPDLVEYVFNRTRPEDYKDIDQLAFVQASFVGQYWLVKLLIQRGSDPRSATATFDQLVRADPNYFEDDEANPYYTTLKYIIEHYHFISRLYMSLEVASYAGHQSILELLLSIYPIPSDDQAHILMMAILGDQLDLIQWLITYPGMSDDIIQDVFLTSFGFARTTSYDTYYWLITNVDAIRGIDWNMNSNLFNEPDIPDIVVNEPDISDIVVNDPGLLPKLNQKSLIHILQFSMENNRPDIAKIILPLLPPDQRNMVHN